MDKIPHVGGRRGEPTFCCLLCGSSSYERMRVRRAGGGWYTTDFCQCSGCSALFRDPARFSGHHLALSDRERPAPEATESECAARPTLTLHRKNPDAE